MGVGSFCGVRGGFVPGVTTGRVYSASQSKYGRSYPEEEDNKEDKPKKKNWLKRLIEKLFKK